MSAFAVHIVLTSGVGIEIGTDFNKVANTLGSLADNNLHNLPIVDATTSNHSILDMLLERVVAIHNRGNTTLCLDSGSIVYLVFANYSHTTIFADFCRIEQASDSTAYH